jgi:hypothetical protein
MDGYDVNQDLVPEINGKLDGLRQLLWCTLDLRPTFGKK